MAGISFHLRSKIAAPALPIICLPSSKKEEERGQASFLLIPQDKLSHMAVSNYREAGKCSLHSR